MSQELESRLAEILAILANLERELSAHKIHSDGHIKRLDGEMNSFKQHVKETYPTESTMIKALSNAVKEAVESVLKFSGEKFVTKDEAARNKEDLAKLVANNRSSVDKVIGGIQVLATLLILLKLLSMSGING